MRREFHFLLGRLVRLGGRLVRLGGWVGGLGGGDCGVLCWQNLWVFSPWRRGMQGTGDGGRAGCVVVAVSKLGDVGTRVWGVGDGSLGGVSYGRGVFHSGRRFEGRWVLRGE